MSAAGFDPDHSPGPVPSPCISVCQMDARGQLCLGCQRTLGEIAAWGSADEESKRQIWRAVRERREAMFG